MRADGFQRPPVKVALMGLGRAMFGSHCPVFREHPALFEVVAACDILKDRRDTLAVDFPACRMFRRYDDMLDEPGIDLVVVATGSKSHVEHAIMSLERGRWTLLETPMALTFEDAQLLRGAAVKSKNRLVVYHRGLFDPDFLLAKAEMSDPRLGAIYSVSVRREDFVRRDDWQTLKNRGGGASYYAMQDLVLQTLKLMPSPPVQMWSELKRVASLGDTEDFAHVRFKTRQQVTADVEYNGGSISPEKSPSFTIRGSRGVFTVMPGASKGRITMIDPAFKFPRRRSSVRVHPIADMHESFPVVSEDVELPRGTACGQSLFWKHLYESVRVAAPFPLQLEDSIECVKLSRLMKKTSLFGR